MNDSKLENCPADECQGAVKRLLGVGSGIIFKGSGFYKTDNRSSSYQAGAKAESGSGDSAPKSDSSGKSEGSGKSDSAPKPDSSPKPAPAAKPAD